MIVGCTGCVMSKINQPLACVNVEASDQPDMSVVMEYSYDKQVEIMVRLYGRSLRNTIEPLSIRASESLNQFVVTDYDLKISVDTDTIMSPVNKWWDIKMLFKSKENENENHS